MSSPITLNDLHHAVGSARKKGAVIGAGVALVAIVLFLVFRSMFETYVHVGDDYRRGASFTGKGDCEAYAEAMYGHDLFGDGPYNSSGYSSRAQKAFYSGCTRHGFPSD